MGIGVQQAPTQGSSWRGERFRLRFAQGGPLQGDAVGGLQEPVQDGLGEGGVGHGAMPGLDGKLACDEGGAARAPALQFFFDACLYLLMRQVI